MSPSQLDALLQYIDEEQEHHRTRTFQEEYRELLRKHGVDFDERYVCGLKRAPELIRAFSACFGNQCVLGRFAPGYK